MLYTSHLHIAFTSFHSLVVDKAKQFKINLFVVADRVLKQ